MESSFYFYPGSTCTSLSCLPILWTTSGKKSKLSVCFACMACQDFGKFPILIMPLHNTYENGFYLDLKIFQQKSCFHLVLIFKFLENCNLKATLKQFIWIIILLYLVSSYGLVFFIYCYLLKPTTRFPLRSYLLLLSS